MLVGNKENENEKKKKKKSPKIPQNPKKKDKEERQRLLKMKKRDLLQKTKDEVEIFKYGRDRPISSNRTEQKRTIPISKKEK